ncbi:MAG: 50S ribosomal protein L13 [Candidatus Vogelbacteria bacterium]|nr:50S ribosomal protein L13 [Candidatus Vogelbacteria bacterium]
MEKQIEKKEYVIDATGQALGRVATQVAELLRGKNTTTFVNYLAPKVTVKVINAGKLDVTQKKMRDTIYTHYTGHPGGLRKTSLTHMVEKKGWAEPIKKAVFGMLPANRLRAVMIKNLIITE